jgi:hypothetical protein
VQVKDFSLQFDPDRLHAWEAQNEARRRAAKIDAAFSINGKSGMG